MAVALSDTPSSPRQASGPRQRRLGNRPRLWAITVAILAQRFLAALRERAAAARADESGNVITDNLAWIVFGVVAIVVIGALIKTLGSNVLNWVQTQLGIG